MKDILFDGHRILTTDNVADAVLDYARVLLEHDKTDIVRFPTLYDGSLSQCAILLGASGVLAVVDAFIDLPMVVDGADRACAEISRRADALR